MKSWQHNQTKKYPKQQIPDKHNRIPRNSGRTSILARGVECVSPLSCTRSLCALNILQMNWPVLVHHFPERKTKRPEVRLSCVCDHLQQSPAQVARVAAGFQFTQDAMSKSALQVRPFLKKQLAISIRQGASQSHFSWSSGQAAVTTPQC